LYVAADFQFAGGLPATPIVRWDGAAWSSVPGSLAVPGRAMIGFDPDGPGPQPALLFADTRTWNGQSWSSMSLASVWRYRVLDVGAPALFAIGALGGVARFDSGQWSRVGPALDGVIDLAAWDPDGAGPLPAQIYALLNTGVTCELAAGQWLPLTASAGQSPYALASFDPDGPGPAPATLYVALDGAIRRLAGGKWIDAATFSHPNCSCAPVYEFTTCALPGAPASLVASGYFRYADGALANGLCATTGGDFLPPAPSRGLDASANALLVMDEDGPGPAPACLFVGGLFGLVGTTAAPGLARWDGRSWSSVGGGIAVGMGYYQVTAMTPWDDDGPGPNPPSLVIAGRFTGAGGHTANGIARWDGSDWHDVGSGPSRFVLGVTSLAVFDEDGQSPAPAALFAGGWFTNVAGVPAAGIARWNGSAWSAVGTPPWSGTYVRALAVYDPDGPGPAPAALYAGTDGGAGLYRWDGQSWATIGGLTGSSTGLVTALAVADEDGPGPMRPSLYLGGQFGQAGSAIATSIARFDGQQFSSMGPGLGEFPVPVDAIGVVDWTGGTGAPTIYAGGPFFDASVRGLAMWHAASQQWLPVLGGAEGVRAIAGFDHGGGTAMYTVGSFRESGFLPASSIARFGCPASAACYANCDRSTTAPLLNVADVVCFQQRFAAGDPYANCDGSTVPPVLNVADFVCFQQRFAAGCP
jgi:hypothetical protein